MPEMMKCGHAANSVHTVDGEKFPACVICFGIDSGSLIVDENAPSLDGRVAKCAYNCGAEQPSSNQLAFFENTPDLEFDNYYCGCFGWD